MSFGAFHQIPFDPMTMTTKYVALLALGLLILATDEAWVANAQPARQPSSLLSYAQRPTIEGDGYMVGGEYWTTIKPMNTNDPTRLEDPNGDIGAIHRLRIGPDGTNWQNPGGMWPGGHRTVNYWRDGFTMTFPVFESDGWVDQLKASEETDDRYAFAYYSPDVPGADDPDRNYKREARYTDQTRSHLVYEAGWPTNLGLDFKIRTHQYTINEQNMNDFIVLEVSVTNTGEVDANADGTVEDQSHAIDAMAANQSFLPTTAVHLTESMGRSNRFGAGRTYGYLHPVSSDEIPLYIFHANVPANRTTNQTVPEPGARLIGVNDAARLEGYTDVWNGLQWIGAKQGAIDDNDLSTLQNAPDKETLFGTHPVGLGNEAGWYTSVSNQDASLLDANRADITFMGSTATWYEDFGATRASNFDTRDLSPNTDVFGGGGTPGDVTTFGAATPGVRPTGDFKMGSVDDGPHAVEQPVWEDALNPSAASGDFYDAVGWTREYDFSGTPDHGMGPFSLAVGESMTFVYAMTAGFRWEGVSDATEAAIWAWEEGWDISGSLPTPPAPEVRVESTQDGTATVRWTDVEGIAPIDGYKVWRAAQYQRESWFPSQEEGANGFAFVDNYHHVHEVGGDLKQFADEGLPYFDAFGEFAGETQNFYQPAEWGPYQLVAKIPASEFGQHQESQDGYAYVWEDVDAITGFTYWYYVSAYREGSFTGPQGSVDAGHIESANFNRNGRNSPDAADAEIGLIAPWVDAYPYAVSAADFPLKGTRKYKNIGAPFTVTPPVASNDDVASLITVTPNPYKITGLNDQRNNPSSHAISFLNTPSDFTLTIIDVAGQIVWQEAVEGAAEGSYRWDMFSKDGVEVASGLYIYHIAYGEQEATGHFAILR